MNFFLCEGNETRQNESNYSGGQNLSSFIILLFSTDHDRFPNLEEKLLQIILDTPCI
jgi:hypothetical protein